MEPIYVAIGLLLGVLAALFILRRLNAAADREMDRLDEARRERQRENFWRDSPAVDVERREI